jgi:hypothetical protein
LTFYKYNDIEPLTEDNLLYPFESHINSSSGFLEYPVTIHLGNSDVERPESIHEFILSAYAEDHGLSLWMNV